MYSEFLETPLGAIEIHASESGVTKVIFAEPAPTSLNASNLTRLCAQQLTEYFEGTRKTFDLPLDLHGTAFQKSVWHCLLDVPFGETAAYSDLANKINNPKSVRAVGAANGKNPIGIIVPCHRIIGKDRTLTGYAGGLHRKAWLLRHEGIEFKETADTRQGNLFDH